MITVPPKVPVGFQKNGDVWEVHFHLDGDYSWRSEHPDEEGAQCAVNEAVAIFHAMQWMKSGK